MHPMPLAWIANIIETVCSKEDVKRPGKEEGDDREIRGVARTAVLGLAHPS